MTLTISDAERRTRYSPVISTTAFPVVFPIADLGDVEVWHAGILLDPANYTVTGSLGTDGFYEDAIVTLDTGVTGIVDIVGARPPNRVAQFTEGRGVTARDENIAFNLVTAVAREAFDKLSRALVAAPGTMGAQIAEFVAGGLLIVNADGDGIDMGPDASDIASAQAQATAAAASAVLALAAQAAAEDARDAALAADLTTLLTTRGDMVTRSATVPARLAVGAAGKFLSTDGTDPSWQNLPLIGRNTLCPHTNLVVKRTTVAQATITADALVAFDSSSVPKAVTTVSLTFDISTTGANGREAADAEASSTWYYLWCIVKADGTKAAFGSKTATPTLPSGYLYKGLVGMLYNNGSSNLDNQVQRGEFTNCRRGTALSTGSQSGSYAAVSLAQWVPPNAKAVELLATLRTVSSTALVSVIVTNDATNVDGDRAISQEATVNGQTLYVGWIALTTAQQIAYQRSTTGNGNVDLIVVGWRY